MTRAHVPPQCAGNTDAVTRAKWMLNSETSAITLGRYDRGGIHFPGQCDSCNKAAGRHFDPSYGALSDALRPLWAASLGQPQQESVPMPSIQFRPGAVARSIILGMCATTPLMRANWPQVAAVLDPMTAVQLPAGHRLFLAFARGKTAWVSGSTLGIYDNVSYHQSKLLMALSSVFFPPLAWQLVGHGERTLVEDGWVDVSDWLSFPITDTHDLQQLVARLPMVKHPRHTVDGAHWVEFIQDDVSGVMECLDVLDHDSDDARTRQRHIERIKVPMEEARAVVEQYLRRRDGMVNSHSPNAGRP